MPARGWRRSAVLLAVALAGCRTAAPRQTEFMESLPGLDLTINELRFLVLDFHDYFVSAVDRATRDMVAQQESRSHQINAVAWRSNSVSAAQEFAFQTDPLVALVELLVLSARMRDFFDGPAAERLFGPPYPIAVQAARDLDRRAKEVARRAVDAPDIDERLARIDSVAATDPLEDLSFLEGSILVDPEAFVTESAGGLGAIGSIEQTTRDLSERVNVYYRYLPKQLRWEAELLALMAYEGGGEELAADVGDMAGALVSLDARLATLTDSLAGELEALADEVVARERDIILNEVDRERLATLAALHGELEFVLADVERQRTETIRALDALIVETRGEIVADVDAAVDAALGRVLRVALVLLLGLTLALAALILLFNRTRSSSTTA